MMLWVSGSTGLKSVPTADVGNIFSSGCDSTENQKKKETKKQTTLPMPLPPVLLVGHKQVCERLQLDNLVHKLSCRSWMCFRAPQYLWLSFHYVCWVLTHFSPVQSTQMNYAGNGLQIKLNINMIKMSLSSDKVAMHMKFLI